jgi:2-hydroxychromene-2-carboxylate isomerase
MSRAIDLYIDIISPYCYLAYVRLPALAAKHGYTLRHHPIHIASAKLAAGNYGPSNMEVVPKGKALVRDLERWAKRYGVPLRFPKSIVGEPWNIGILFADRHGKAEAYLRQAYRLLWAEGGDPADHGLLRLAAMEAGLNQDEFLDYVTSSLGRTEFRKESVDAHTKGIFGAPIMIVDDELFWGNDRLDFLEEYIMSREEV